MPKKVPEGYMLDPPEWGSPDRYLYLIERTMPKPDGGIGDDAQPSRLVKVEPMADLSKPEDFPEEVRAIIESAPDQSFFKRLIS
jgi:hypothetical protein